MRRLLEGRRLFQCGYPKVRRLLEEIRYADCAFPQNLQTRKLGEITVFYAVDDDSHQQ